MKFTNLKTVLFILIFLILFLLPTITSNLYYIRVVQMVAIFSLLGLGLNFLFGYTGQISIGHAAFYAFGAYVSAILETKYQIHFIIAWGIAIFFTAIIAYFISFPILKLKGHYLAMATLAFGLIIEVILVQWIPMTGGHDGITIMTAQVLGGWLAKNLYFFILGSVFLIYWLLNNIANSSVGRAHKALRDDEVAAEALGIPVMKYKVNAFVLSAMIASIAGIWYAHLSMVITPEVFGLHTSIQILLLVVIGGLGSNLGAILGAIFIVTLPEFLYQFKEADILIFGIVVFIVLLFFPKGIIGMVDSLLNYLKQKTSKTSMITKSEKSDTHVFRN